MNTSESTDKVLGLESFHIQLGYLEGKVLTIVEASYGDTEQRTAIKGLIKKMFREQRDHVDSIVYGSNTQSTNYKVESVPIKNK